MPAESASASANTGINSPGGSINKNSPSVIVIALLVVAVVVGLFFLWRKP